MINQGCISISGNILCIVRLLVTAGLALESVENPGNEPHCKRLLNMGVVFILAERWQA